MNIITLTDLTLLSIKFKLSVGLWHTLLVVHFWTCSRFWRSSKVTNFEDASFPSCWSLIKLSLLISKSWIKSVVFMKIHKSMLSNQNKFIFTKHFQYYISSHRIHEHFTAQILSTFWLVVKLNHKQQFRSIF